MANIFVAAPAIISLVMGLLILSYPKLLRLLIGWYLVIIGILGLIAAF